MVSVHAPPGEDGGVNSNTIPQPGKMTSYDAGQADADAALPPADAVP
jgi:hypothetical protein